MRQYQAVIDAGPAMPFDFWPSTRLVARPRFLAEASTRHLALADLPKIKVDQPASKRRTTRILRERFFSQKPSRRSRIVTRRHTIVVDEATSKPSWNHGEDFRRDAFFYLSTERWVEERPPLPSNPEPPTIQVCRNRSRKKGLGHRSTTGRRHDRKPVPWFRPPKLPAGFPHPYETIHCEPMHRSCFASGRISDDDGRANRLSLRRRRGRQSAVGSVSTMSAGRTSRSRHVTDDPSRAWIRMSFRWKPSRTPRNRHRAATAARDAKRSRAFFAGRAERFQTSQMTETNSPSIAGVGGRIDSLA